MLEKLYDLIEERQEAKSVLKFLAEYAPEGDVEDKFLEAVRDSKFVGFCESVKTALLLLREAS